MEHYRRMYPDNAAWIYAIASNLEDDIAEWLVSLHDARAWDLGDLDAFMQILRRRFEDPMVAQCTESCIHTLKQGKWLVAEYIQDFHSLASHLPD